MLSIVLSKKVQISWILSTTAYPLAVTITVIYWIALYKGSLTPLQFYLQFNVHAIQVNKLFGKPKSLIANKLSSADNGIVISSNILVKYEEKIKK